MRNSEDLNFVDIVEMGSENADETMLLEFRDFDDANSSSYFSLV